MNTDVEIRLMNLFKEYYDEFPFGNLLKTNPPAPDFILTLESSETIGIELTETLHSEKAKQSSSVTKELTNLVLYELESKLPFTFSIDIDLDLDVSITKQRRKQIAAAAVRFCVNEFQNLKNIEHRSVENIQMDLAEVSTERPDILASILQHGYRNLPQGVKRIRMSRFDGLDHSWNMQAEGGAVPNFTDHHLQTILEKKEKRLIQYTYCDQFWLIITEGNYFTGSFDKIIINDPFVSGFNKIFIIRSSKKKIITLK